MPGRVYVPVYKRWWFWALVALGTVAAWQAVLYFNWEGEQGKYAVRNAVADAYMEYIAKHDAELEAAYKADTYGGATPEETLKLFIEALEKKDYELASKYFVVERQQSALVYLERGLPLVVAAYGTGEIKTSIDSLGGAIIEIFPKGQVVPFGFELKLNTSTNKWKLIK